MNKYLFYFGLFLLAINSTNTYAYLGPGAGLSAIGSVLALIGATLLLIVGFVWYPVKRMLRNKKNRSENSEEKPD